jgi:Domain of unknown function (DUF4405)
VHFLHDRSTGHRPHVAWEFLLFHSFHSLMNGTVAAEFGRWTGMGRAFNRAPHDVGDWRTRMIKTTFSFRTFTTLILAWTFLALMVSGTVLYVSPPGRIANWTRWSIIALTKQQWQAVHTLSAIVFLTGGLFHLLKFNWKAFVAYLRRRGGETGLRFRWEIVASLTLFGVVMAGTVAALPPFGSIMVAGERIKESWGVPGDEPPVPHLELQSLGDVAAKLGIKPDTAVRVLQEKGITAPEAGAPLKDVASRNRRTPREVYDALQQASGTKAEPAAHGAPGTGSGMGTRTVVQVAEELGLSAAAALKVLEANGLEAKLEEDLRTVAFRKGRRPFEVYEILKAAASAGTTSAEK